MAEPYNYRVRRLGTHELHPETQMMGYGFSPHLSEGALKPPVFLTSTFVFKSAQAGKDFFDFTSGRRMPGPGEEAGLVYSRFNNPNLEVLEDRLCLFGIRNAETDGDRQIRVRPKFSGHGGKRVGNAGLHSRHPDPRDVIDEA